MSIIQGKCINYALQIFKDFWKKNDQYKCLLCEHQIWANLELTFRHVIVLPLVHLVFTTHISFWLQQCDFVLFFLEFLLRPTYKIWSLHSLNLCEGVNLVMIGQVFRDTVSVPNK